MGEEFTGEIKRLEELRERLSRGRFHLAVLGQFKRGKSTLINALLGEAVLPTAVIPLTSIPTYIRQGENLRTRVLFKGNRPSEEFATGSGKELMRFLEGYVTESGNSKNRREVEEVEVCHPADILRKGVILIDTPGIGSTFRHNTEATLNFLPLCDAALFLLSADPPVTEVEVEFLKQVRSKVSRLFFIMNKVDYLNEDERKAALQFLKDVLREQVGIEDAPVFCLSAMMGLKARQTQNPALWRESGMEEVEQHLVYFLANEKSAALQTAIARKADGVLENVLMLVRLSIRSMQMPLEELQQRLEIFKKKIGEVQRERLVANDLLTGDSKRIHEFLEEQAEALRAKATAYLLGAVKEVLAMDGRKGEDSTRERLDEVIPGFFEHHMGEATTLFDKRISEVLQSHQRRADELIESIRLAAAELFDVPYKAPESAGVFEIERKPYWVTRNWATTFLNPISPEFIDRFLPKGIRKSRMMKRLTEQIMELVNTNVENLRWPVFLSIDETFRRFGSTLDERLAATIEATHGAIQAALTKRHEQAEVVDKEAARLAAAEAELMQIKKHLEQDGPT